MSKVYFSHKRSTYYQAVKMLLIALGFPLCMWGMLEFFAENKVPDNQTYLIYAVSIAVSIFIILVFVIPKLRRSGTFLYEVTDQLVTCEYPGGESYQVATNDIMRLIQVKRTTGNMWFDDFIETHDGRCYAIPKNYDLNIHAAKKAIVAANPSVSRENEVKY